MFLLLSGCGVGEELLSVSNPAPAPSVENVTPEPTPGIAGQVQVEVLQDASGPETVVLLTSEAGLAQEFVFESEYRIAGGGQVTQADVDFDGNDDLLLCLGGERGGQVFYAAFLWEPEQERFRHEPSFSDIPSPMVDAEHFVIWGGYDTLSEYCCYAYEYLDGEFRNTHTLIGDYARKANLEGEQCTEYAQSDGVEEKVGWQEFPGKGLVGAVEAYISSGAAWEGWGWCDPRAFEVKG